MNILIINQPLGNRGDESAHRALVRALLEHFPKATIKVLVALDLNNKYLSFVEQHSNVEYVVINHSHDYRMAKLMQLSMMLHIVKLVAILHPFLRKFIACYKNADVVICAPGGICMGGFQSWRHLYFLNLAKLYKKKLCYYSRSFGPFPTKTIINRIFKKYSEEMLRYFSFLSIRDAKSMLLADERNLKYVKAVDTAFLDTPNVSIPENIQCNLSAEYMVLVPNTLTWHYVYKKTPQIEIDTFFLQLMRTIREQYPTIQIVMLPQLCDVPNGDYKYFLQLADKMQDDLIYVIDDRCSSDLQQMIIRGAKFLVGARYHSVVFAINNKVPFISLSYEHKMNGLLEILQLEANQVDISTREFQQALALFKVKLKTIDILAPTVEQYNKAKQLVNECMKTFLNTVN